MTDIQKLVHELNIELTDVMARDIRRVIDYLHSRGYLGGVADGYVLVPKEPTGPMIMYGIHAHEKNDDLPDIGLGPKCVGIYKAMLGGIKHE